MIRVSSGLCGNGARFMVGAALFAAALFAGRHAPVARAAAALEMKFVKIAPGEFTMGCSSGDEACNADERPAHKVRITKAFEMGVYEVTQAEWTGVMDSNPSANKGNDHPVDTVSKTEVEQFLSKLNARNDGYRYRLPTEAEWEYAARAGNQNAYAGSLDAIAWYASNSEDESHPVGKKKPNAWGLYDMAGNVREWVADQYSATYYGSSPMDDPAGPPPGQGGRGGRRGRGGRGDAGPRGEGGPRGDGGPPQDGSGPPGGRGRPGPPPPFAADFAPPPPPPDGVAQNQNGPPNGGGGRGGRRGGRGGGPPGGRDLPVIRGGAWDNPASYLRVSARYNYYGPTLRVSDLGFRVVRVPIAQ